MIGMELLTSAYRITTIHDINAAIERLEREISEVYKDISRSHFESAIQAYCASRIEERRTIELSSCAAHMRDAYNILDSSIDKVIEVKTFFGFSSRTDNRYSLTEQVYGAIFLCKIASCLELLYKEFDDLETSKFWRNKIGLNVDRIAEKIPSCYLSVTVRNPLGDWDKYIKEGNGEKLIIDLYTINKKFVDGPLNVSRSAHTYQNSGSFKVSKAGSDYLKNIAVG